MPEPQFDLVIRGGTLADGSGGPLREADVAIKGGIIAGLGRVPGRGREEIDARGLLVTPGVVDIHTHYDGQATWASALSPSSWHGVTTALMGNCGVGFAPCRPGDRDRLIRLMEGVEDIPGAVLAEGLPWTWETFADYLAALETRRFDIDIAAQLPHGALRVYVMGERGARREPATADDIAAMRALAAEAMRAGALGFSTSRTLNHRTSDGDPTPSLTAGEDELTGIAMGLADAGAGVLQLVSDFADPMQELGMLERIVRASGRPLSFSLLQADRAPDAWQRLLGWVERCTGEGLPVKAQVCGRPVGLLLGLSLTLNPFSAHPAYARIAHLPLDARVREMHRPEVKAAILGEAPASGNPFLAAVLRNFARMFPLGDPPDYEPEESASIGARAGREGVAPESLAYDLLLADGGRAMLLFPFLNYSETSLEPARAMLLHKDAVPGLSDGGAHVGMICDGSFPTTMLSYWARDRRRGPLLDLPFVVAAQTRRTAEAVGLYDRGLLAPGMKADLNVIDFSRLALRRPEVVHDLPAGGRRLVQRAEGYVATIVSGQVTYRDGNATAALPGRLVRGAKRRPHGPVA